MRRGIYFVLFIALLLLIQIIGYAHEQVVVVPLGTQKTITTGSAKFYDTTKWQAQSESDLNNLQPTIPHARVPKTGISYSTEIGSDGNLQKGVAWPVPRFTDNNDGTITDNLTGLVWLKNIACDGNISSIAKAVEFNMNLQDGDCGLNDGSNSGDWRIPNIKEIQSLFRYGSSITMLPDTLGGREWSNADPFVFTKDMIFFDQYLFMTSTIRGDNYYVVSLKDGRVELVRSGSELFANWPVRNLKN